MLEISDLLKKFFMDYAYKTHMNEWNNPDSFFKPENSIDEVVKECRAFEDMYAQKILQTIEKRIDERIERYHNKDTMYPSIMQRIGGMEEIKEMLR